MTWVASHPHQADRPEVRDDWPPQASSKKAFPQEALQTFPVGQQTEDLYGIPFMSWLTLGELSP